MQQLSAWFRDHRRWEWLLPLGFLAAVLFIYAALYGGGSPAAESRDPQEKALEEILSLVEGAGQVRVMIAKEESVSAFSSSDTAKETISGVIVAAEGADSVAVRIKLAQAVMTALNTDPDQVEILPMQKDETHD